MLIQPHNPAFPSVASRSVLAEAAAEATIGDYSYTFTAVVPVPPLFANTEFDAGKTEFQFAPAEDKDSYTIALPRCEITVTVSCGLIK